MSKDLELLMIKYKATVNYLGEEQSCGPGWHCCINPERLGMVGDRIHVTCCVTPHVAISKAIEILESR